jgi:S-adenosylmethionine hydrolase
LSIITLTTDFGSADGYVGAMKGVILGIAPQARIVDITHQLLPQNVRAAAWVLHNVVPYFPKHAIHVAVIDPGVGSTRRALAVRTATALFVGPDNGVFSYVLPTIAHRTNQERSNAPFDKEADTEIFCLDNPRYWLADVSRTFHGRDIFSPVAAHLAAGVPLEAMGTPISDPITFPFPQAKTLEDGTIHGEIIYQDHFGNLISNVSGAWLAGQHWHIHIAGRRVIGPSLTYAAVRPGELVALVGSSGQLEIAVRDGSAAHHLDAGPGEPVVVEQHGMER